jgi:hypothetical protein
MTTPYSFESIMRSGGRVQNVQGLVSAMKCFGYVFGNASISYFAMIVGIVLVSLPVTQSLV